MNRTLIFTLMTVAVVVSLSAVPVVIGQSDEWPDQQHEAKEISPGTYSGVIASQDDTDYMKVPVQAGDTVTVTLDKEIRKDTWMYLEWPGAPSSYSSDGITIDDESAETLTRKITAEETGYLYIQVSSYTVETNTESWELRIDRTRGSDSWNDDQYTAEEVSPGLQTGVVNSPDDTD